MAVRAAQGAELDMVSEETFSPVVAALAISVVFVVLLAMMVAELPFGDIVRTAIDRHAQKAMLLVAAVSTASSLYYSEYAGFTPCDFCWYQRIMMYPLAILLLVALVSRSRIDARYIVTMAGIGLALSIYHYQLEMFPNQAEICSGAVSCTKRFVEEFGFVSIPFMAGCGFLTILLLQFFEWRVNYLYRQWSETEVNAEELATS